MCHFEIQHQLPLFFFIWMQLGLCLHWKPCWLNLTKNKHMWDSYKNNSSLVILYILAVLSKWFCSWSIWNESAAISWKFTEHQCMIVWCHESVGCTTKFVTVFFNWAIFIGCITIFISTLFALPSNLSYVVCLKKYLCRDSFFRENSQKSYKLLPAKSKHWYAC